MTRDLEAQVEEFQRSFNLHWDKSQAAIKCYNEANGISWENGNYSWPDLTKMLDWYIARSAQVESANKYIALLQKELGACHSAVKDQAAQVEALSKALADCADDLEASVKAEYSGTQNYPSQVLKYKHDMEPVIRARAVLNTAPAPVEEPIGAKVIIKGPAIDAKDPHHLAPASAGMGLLHDEPIDENPDAIPLRYAKSAGNCEHNRAVDAQDAPAPAKPDQFQVGLRGARDIAASRTKSVDSYRALARPKEG